MPLIRRVGYGFELSHSTLGLVLPVRNDPDRLEHCLRSIRRAEGGLGCPIVVADNGSVDDTAERALAAGARVLSVPNVTVAAARNEAARQVATDLIGFVDADHEIDAEWVRAAVEVMGDTSVGGAGALYEPPEPGTWVQRAYGALRGRTRGQHDTEWLGAGNLVVRRAAFDAVGGFDPALEACEDVDLCKKLRAAGWRLVADERLRSVHHGDPPTVGRVFRSELWRGRDNLRVTLRRPWRWRSTMSLVIPAAHLASLPAVVALAAMRLGAGPWQGWWWPAVIPAAIVLLRTWRLWRALPIADRPRVGFGGALAVAWAYELGRALALVLRVPHHRAHGARRA